MKDLTAIVVFAAILIGATMSAHAGAMADEPPILVQYEGRPSGQPGSEGGPGWYSGPGQRGEWHGGPEWHRSWASTWGGGWYGGWFQPYWGIGASANPYWEYGHPDYYGGSPGL